MSAFLLYCNDNRELVNGANPEASFGELGKLLADKWKSIDDNGKKKYEVLATKDKERYQKEMEVYNREKKNEEHKVVSRPSQISRTAITSVNTLTAPAISAASNEPNKVAKIGIENLNLQPPINKISGPRKYPYVIPVNTIGSIISPFMASLPLAQKKTRN